MKGRLAGRFPAQIEKGIKLHRAIDRFTDEHPVTRTSARRLPRRFHRYGGIIADITYDHLLAVNWHQYYDTSLDDFSRSTLTTLLEYCDYLPEDALRTATRMHELNSLAGYSERVFLERSLGYLSTRLTRDNPLDEAATEVMHHLDSMTDDLEQFYPELRLFCDEWRQNH